MKVASLRGGGRDGALVVVRSDNQVFARADGVAPTLQAALDDWAAVAPRLEALSAALASETGTNAGQPLDPRALAAPLPRAYEWIDGSAYLNHVVLARKARGADPPDTLATDPRRLQGRLRRAARAATDDIPLRDPAWGPRLRGRGRADDPRRHTTRHARGRRGGVRAPRAARKRHHAAQPGPRRAREGLRLLPVEAGDRVLAARAHARRVRYRRGATVACTLRLRTVRNGQMVRAKSMPDQEMHFSFFDLIAHVAQHAQPAPAARSWAAARCPTSIRRAASPASPSDGRGRSSPAARR